MVLINGAEYKHSFNNTLGVIHLSYLSHSIVSKSHPHFFSESILKKLFIFVCFFPANDKGKQLVETLPETTHSFLGAIVFS